MKEKIFDYSDSEKGNKMIADYMGECVYDYRNSYNRLIPVIKRIVKENDSFVFSDHIVINENYVLVSLDIFEVWKEALRYIRFRNNEL